MDRFGIGYLAIAVVLFTLPVHTCGTQAPTPSPTPSSSLSASFSDEAKTQQFSKPPVAADADVVAIIQSGDSTFRVLVGEDREGRLWSAAFDDSLPK